MTLTLRAVSLNEQPLTQPITAHFDEQGGTIGRADHNLMALPDPERHISRQQAQIIRVGNGYRIKNVGSANPILVRGQPLAQGESAAIAHRDQMRIGGYLLEVSEDGGDDEAAHTILHGRAAVNARTGGGSPATPAHPLTPRGQSGGSGAFDSAELGLPISSSNPFADLLGPSTPAPTSAADVTPAVRPAKAVAAPARDDPFSGLVPSPKGAPPGSGAFAAPARPSPPRLPDDFDPFAPPPAAPLPLPAPASANRVRPGEFDDLIPAPAEDSIDVLFDLRGDSPDPMANFVADVKAAQRTAESPGAGEGSTDPFALFNDPPATPGAPTVSDHTPALHEAYTPPRIAPTPPPSPVAARAPALPARAESSSDTAVLWQAFCEGAGIRAESQPGLDPELMRVTGAVLRAAVEGTLQLLVARTAIKREMNADVTVIHARNNNPLKFSPDAQSALEQLLQPPLRGFLDGPAAMTDAMHDLVGHSIGTMAGTRAALEGVLDRFSPQALEAKLRGKSMIDALLPKNRKAKLWELYLQHAQGIRGEAQDDFATLFGKAFLAAYEEQLDRLQSAAPSP